MVEQVAFAADGVEADFQGGEGAKGFLFVTAIYARDTFAGRGVGAVVDVLRGGKLIAYRLEGRFVAGLVDAGGEPAGIAEQQCLELVHLHVRDESAKGAGAEFPAQSSGEGL